MDCSGGPEIQPQIRTGHKARRTICTHQKGEGGGAVERKLELLLLDLSLKHLQGFLGVSVRACQGREPCLVTLIAGSWSLLPGDEISVVSEESLFIQYESPSAMLRRLWECVRMVVVQ